MMTEAERAIGCTPERSSHHSPMGIPRGEMRVTEPGRRAASHYVESPCGGNGDESVPLASALNTVGWFLVPCE